MEKYDFSIAISGTHGKTTTTSMITHLFNMSKKDPTALIGGNFKEIGGNVEIGKTDYFITEACEYVDSFLHFYPKIAVITNIEEDHLDYFKDLKQIQGSFLQFSNQVKDNGFTVAFGDSDHVRTALKNSDSKIYYYGFSDKNDFIIKNPAFDSSNFQSFDIYQKDKLLGNFNIRLFGNHNILNASAAIIVCYLCNIPIDEIKENIPSFLGVNRRFEYKGTIYENVKIYDDYAHHPTEIKATIETASKIKTNRLITVFQPHTYTRTRTLFDDFVTAFDLSDVAIFVDIYAAREIDDGTISSKMLCDAIKKRGVNSYYFSNFEDTCKFLKENFQKDDIFFTIGAGNVYKIGDILLDNK